MPGMDAAAGSVRVFVVDDSPTARLGLRRMLESTGDLEVVGEASGGRAALRQIPELRPNVVLMDVAMPGLDGLETTRRLMSQHPVPIVLISDLVGRRAELNFQALDAGALDLLRKPTREELEDPAACAALARRLRVLAPVPLVTRRAGRRARHDAVPATATPVQGPARPAESAQPAGDPAPRDLERVSVGASTGGPVALAKLLSGFATPPPWPIAVVQHMSPGFVHGLARWLAGECGLPVEVVDESIQPQPGVVYLSGDHQHLVWDGAFLVPSSAARHEAATSHCPSVDELFFSAAAAPRPARHAGVLLTGMGADGARGLLALRRAGAVTVGQAESSCVVFGMPKAARDLGAVERLMTAENIAPFLEQLHRARPAASETRTESIQPSLVVR